MHSLHYSAWDELSFYEEHQGDILPHIESHLRTRPLGCEIRTEGLEHTPLSEEQIRAALGAFPESCDQRTRLVRVLGRSSAQAGLKQDGSPYPTFSTYEISDPGKGVEFHVVLNALDEIPSSDEAKMIAHYCGVFHGACRGLLTTRVYAFRNWPGDPPPHVLRFPDGGTYPLVEALRAYRTVAVQYPPLTRGLTGYTDHFYHPFPGNDDAWSQHCCYHLAEAVAAYYVGAALDHNNQGKLNPLDERPDQREFVERFLRATVVEA